MTTEDDTQESGGALRANLEAALAENKALRSKVIDGIVASHKFVKAEDFKDVALDQFATKAQEVEQARRADAESGIRALLAERLGSDVDLDKALADLGVVKDDDKPDEKPASGPTFTSGVGIAGTPPAAQTDNLYGFDRMVAAAADTLKRLG